MSEWYEQVPGVGGRVARSGEQGERAMVKAHLSFQAGCVCHLPNLSE